MSNFRLCNRLRVARAEKTLSQEQLALLAGVTRQTISSIETGQYNPSAFLALVLVGGIGALPTIGEYLPGRLFSWGATLMLGGNGTAWPAFGISLGIIVIALLAACMIFHRQEI